MESAQGLGWTVRPHMKSILRPAICGRWLGEGELNESNSDKERLLDSEGRRGENAVGWTARAVCVLGWHASLGWRRVSWGG
jgi:hypothetical protein